MGPASGGGARARTPLPRPGAAAAGPARPRFLPPGGARPGVDPHAALVPARRRQPSGARAHPTTRGPTARVSCGRIRAGVPRSPVGPAQAGALRRHPPWIRGPHPSSDPPPPRPQITGESPLDLAAANGHAALADRLRAAQAAGP